MSEESYYFDQKMTTHAVGVTTFDIVREEIQDDGIIPKISVEFPQGCNSLVDLKIYHNNVKIVPKSGATGLRLNNWLLEIPINKPVKRGDNIDYYIDNGDDTNSHTLNIIMDIKIKVT